MSRSDDLHTIWLPARTATLEATARFCTVRVLPFERYELRAPWLPTFERHSAETLAATLGAHAVLAFPAIQAADVGEAVVAVLAHALPASEPLAIAACGWCGRACRLSPWGFGYLPPHGWTEIRSRRGYQFRCRSCTQGDWAGPADVAPTRRSLRTV